jgi:hypothetical protein
LKGILEYFDKELGCKVQVDIEADTLLKARKACQKELEGKKYTEPALYIESQDDCCTC